MGVSDQTRLFSAVDKETNDTKEILAKVWTALKKRLPALEDCRLPGAG